MGWSSGHLQEEIYRIIAENTSDTIVLVDNQGVVRYSSFTFRTHKSFRLPDDNEQLIKFLD